MSILSKVTDIIGGSIFKEAKEIITTYWPPDISPQQRAEMEIKLADLDLKKQLEINIALADAEKTLNERIAQQEGTAADLKQIPVLGSIMLFLRGVQRPAFGFFTMYMDFIWFTTAPGYTEQQQTALIVINVLVLGFLFGERTIKNLEPLIVKVFGGKNG